MAPKRRLKISLSFDLLENDLLTFMGIYRKLPEALNQLLQWSIAKTICLGWGIVVSKNACGGSGEECYYQGRSRLAVLRQNV